MFRSSMISFIVLVPVTYTGIVSSKENTDALVPGPWHEN